MLSLARAAEWEPPSEEESALLDAHVLMHAFRLDQERRALSPETIRVREVVLRGFTDYRHGDLLGATRRDVHAWLDSLAIVARSRAKYLSHLRCFYRFALREELTERDPTAAIDAPRLPRALPRPIGNRDLLRALHEAPPKVEAMLALACYEGLRCMEIAACQADWFRFDADPPIVLVAGKGRHERVLPLAQETERALARHRMPRAGHVFLSTRGRPYRAGRVSEMLADYLRGLGIEATAHHCRHWFGTEIYRLSRDLVLTQELMGHADPSTTRGYITLSPSPTAAQMVRHLSARRTPNGSHRQRLA